MTKALTVALIALAAGAGCTGGIGANALAGVDGGQGSDGGADGTGGLLDDGGAGPTPGDATAESIPGSDAAANRDGGRRKDAGAMACSSPGTSDWYTYGHDPQRTSASDGCMVGPLTLSFTYEPLAASGGQLASVEHAIATHAAVYVKSADSNNGAQVAAVVDKLTPAGARVWQWAFGDFEEHQWPTFAFGVLAVEEDSMWFVDDSDGKGLQLGEYDDWGTNTADATRFYVSSDVNSKDGYGIYVGAYPAQAPTPLPFPPPEWHANLWGNGNRNGTECGYEVNDSLAVDNAVVYQAGEYRNLSGSPPFPSGVRSFDGTSGTPGWTQPTLPRSAISVGAGKVFLIEQDSGLTLVARRQQDGTVGWSTPLVGAQSIQAPALAGGLLLLAEKDGIDAYDPATGALVWNAPGIDALQTAFVATLNTYFDACGGADDLSTLADTSLAAATGSNTLVVTATDGVHILSLDDGSSVWSGKIAGITGPLKNPVIVGKTLYAIDTGAAAGIGQLVALTSP